MCCPGFISKSSISSSAASTLQGHAPDGSFADRQGAHAVGHIDDFEALQQQLLEGSSLLLKMEAALYSLSASQELRLHQVRGRGGRNAKTVK